jgi:hypothetical protein
MHISDAIAENVTARNIDTHELQQDIDDFAMTAPSLGFSMIDMHRC